MLASSMLLMRSLLVSGSIPPKQEVVGEGHSSMGQNLVNIAAMKWNTPLNQDLGHPSLVLACACHLSPFLILFAMAWASSPVMSGGH
jgi:hypothetical protein